MDTPKRIGFYPENEVALLIHIVDCLMNRRLESRAAHAGNVVNLEAELKSYADDLDRIRKRDKARDRWHTWGQSLLGAVIGAVLGTILTLAVTRREEEPAARLRPAGAPPVQIDQGARKQAPDSAQSIPAK